MIIRNDSERDISPLVAYQSPSMQADASVNHGRMVRTPNRIIPLYTGLLIALGWFGGKQWHHPSLPQTLPLPVARAAPSPLTAAGETAPENPPLAVRPNAPTASVVDNDTLPPLHYSAHVYTSLPEKRSIVSNDKAWSRGDPPLPSLVVGQIQQDMAVFSFNGMTFTLAALDDQPGEKIDEEPKGEQGLRAIRCALRIFCLAAAQADNKGSELAIKLATLCGFQSAVLQKLLIEPVAILA